VATAAPSADAPAKEAPKKKKLVIIIVAVVLLVVIGGGAAMFMMSRKHASEDGEEAAAEAAAAKAPPVFLPMENMVVNLADPGGDRFAQIGVTLELADKKTEDRVKSYLPAIRSGILLIISQRTSEELLQREGKEKLAADILMEVSRPLGLVPKSAAKKSSKGGDEEEEKKPAKSENSPVRRVLFSSFIVQ
jgi:flagellar FliL protein